MRLFAGLDRAIAKHAAPESVAVTARLNESYDVKEGVNLDVDFTRYDLRLIQSKRRVRPLEKEVADKLSRETNT